MSDADLGPSTPPDDAATPAASAESAASAASAQQPTAPVSVETDLADGEWHRLHPATPLLKGGIGFIVVLGIVISNLRERLVAFFVPDVGRYESGDPIDQIVEYGLVGWVLLGVAVVLLIAIGLFYLSWRMHTFRVTDELVEVRSGLVFRTNRRARLDRIQGINVVRPLFARLFGAAKLEVSVAGQDANVQLSYLGSGLADALRRDILRIASGMRAAEHPSPSPSPSPSAAPSAPSADSPTGPPTPAVSVGNAGNRGFSQPLTGDSADQNPQSPAFPARNGSDARPAPTGLVGRRLSEISAEFEPAAPPESVVSIHTGRLIGSLVLSGFTIFVLIAIGVVIFGAVAGSPWILFAILPGLIGSASYYSRRFVRALRYNIAGTPDGVRIGFGVLSTSNDTIPPGRIHAVEVRQPLLWRAFGWWEIRINRAGHSSVKGATADANTTILPVGSIDDVRRVLGLLLPGFLTEQSVALVEAGMRSRGDSAFTAPPRRAVWLRPFSWRRTGYALLGDVALMRKGAVWRQLVLVPLARVQSVGIEQGPVQRMLGLADARVHTVLGPVTASVGVLSTAGAKQFFDIVSHRAVDAANRDTTHRWGDRGAEPVDG